MNQKPKIVKKDERERRENPLYMIFTYQFSAILKLAETIKNDKSFEVPPKVEKFLESMKA